MEVNVKSIGKEKNALKSWTKEANNTEVLIIDTMLSSVVLWKN